MTLASGLTQSDAVQGHVMLSVLTCKMDLSENRTEICVVIEQMVCDMKQLVSQQ